MTDPIFCEYLRGYLRSTPEASRADLRCASAYVLGAHHAAVGEAPASRSEVAAAVAAMLADGAEPTQDVAG